MTVGEHLKDYSGCSNDIYCRDIINSSQILFCECTLRLRMDFGIKYVDDLKITGTFKLTLSFNLLEVYEDMNQLPLNYCIHFFKCKELSIKNVSFKLA